MRILIATPFHEQDARGNSVAARRLRDGFLARGCSARILGAPEVHQVPAVVATVRDFQPDLILVLHAYRCQTAFHACRKATAAPIVISLRGTDLNEMIDEPDKYSAIATQLDAAAAMVVFHEQGRARLRGFCSAWGAKAVVIPNGACLSPTQGDLRTQLGLPQQAFVFVSIAGLRPVKRPLLVLPWLRTLHLSFPQLCWLHAGVPADAVLVTQLQQWRAREQWVHHLGQLPHEQMGSLLATGNAFVSSSRSEGMPHAVREAMLAGLPLLLSDIPGHRAMAHDHEEALFFSNEATFLAAARWFLEHPEDARLMGDHACRRITRQLLDADEVGSYLQCFKTAIAEGQSS